MRILLINTLYAPYKVGGAERSVQLLAEALVALGHSVRVVSLCERGSASLESLNNVEVVRLPLANVYWPFSSSHQPLWKRIFWHICDLHNPVMAKKVASVLDEFQPDVVHTNNLAGFSTSLWSMIKKRRLPLIHTARDYYLFHPNATLFSKNKNQSPTAFFVRLWSMFRRRASRQVDAFIGISDYITQLHVTQHFFSKARAHRIYNTVSIDMADAYSATTHSPQIHDPKSIGFIGRLIEAKGFDVFCDLAERYRNNEALQFVAAGEAVASPESQRLKKRAESVGVKLLGYTDVSTFLTGVSAVVLPIKWNEPFGRAVVECALSGCEVYTNKKGGVTELFYLFPNLIELDNWSEAPTSSPTKIPEEVSAQFEERTVATQYLNIYQSLNGKAP